MFCIFTLLAINSVNGQVSLDLTNDQELSTTFSDSELKGIASIIQYVDQKVLSDTGEMDIEKAYHSYFEKIATSKEYIVPFKEENKYQFLESLDPAVFNSFWNFTYEHAGISYKDSMYRDVKNFKMLDLKPESRYIKYLQKLGKTDPYFKSLHYELYMAGDLSHDYSEWFPRSHEHFDFNLPKNRLWATVYLLRREENILKKFEQYLRNQ